MILFIIFVILFLILVNAFYVAAEFAAVSVRRNMIREMAEGGSKVAAHLLRILETRRNWTATLRPASSALPFPA